MSLYGVNYVTHLFSSSLNTRPFAQQKGVVHQMYKQYGTHNLIKHVLIFLCHILLSLLDDLILFWLMLNTIQYRTKYSCTNFIIFRTLKDKICLVFTCFKSFRLLYMVMIHTLFTCFKSFRLLYMVMIHSSSWKS